MIVFFVFCLTTSALAIEVPLKYEKFPDKPKSFHPYGVISLNEKTKPPAGEWKMPELISEYPLYAFVKLGDGKRLCILDRQNADDVFYNRLYFDADGNNDLTDDPVIDGTLTHSSNQRCSVSFPAIDTKIEVKGKSLPYSFCPSAYTSRLNQLSKKGVMERNINRYVNFRLVVNCSYSGEFQVNGQRYRVVLGDRNCNGRFNDMFTLRRYDTLPLRIQRIRIYPQGDNIFLVSGEKIDSFDEQVCGNWLMVNDRLFEVSINTAEGKMTLAPVRENLGALNLPMETERISLYTEDGKHCLNAYRPGKEIKVPRGKYRLISYEVFRKDEQGDMWRLCAAATTETPFVNADGSSESVLEFGEPYAPFIVGMEFGVKPPSTRAFLSFNVEGKGKEFLTDVSHISGNNTCIPLSKKKNLRNRPKEPTFKIMEADGEVVHQGSFEYG